MLLRCAVVMLALGALGTPAAAADFPSVVAAILNSQTTGPVAQMEASQKSRLIACVNDVVAGFSNGAKRSVTEGATLDEQEHRFGQLVMANNAEWKQKIARACASIALAGGGIGHN